MCGADSALRWCGRGASVGGMSTLASGAVVAVALLHLYFLVLEMFFWTKPLGRRAFGLTPEFAAASKALAANQGLYNGFLAAGLLWGVGAGAADGYAVKIFFLGCVIVAGIFGAATASRKILWVQAVPGAVALALVCAAK
jgi:putative membrane protein